MPGPNAACDGGILAGPARIRGLGFVCSSGFEFFGFCHFESSFLTPRGRAIERLNERAGKMGRRGDAGRLTGIAIATPPYSRHSNH
jgi:hypothetical protein